MKIGYARVSTDEQNLDLQRHALTAAGCAAIHEDRGLSGAARDRPGLAAALARLAPGDVLVVWKLDRLGRSLPDLVQLLDRLGQAGAGFASLSEAIDTTTAGGRLVFHLLGALAEFERALIAERTRAGMAAAKRRGKHVGRPRKLSPHQLAHARALLASGQETRAGIAALFEVDPTTLRRALGRESKSTPSRKPKSSRWWTKSAGPLPRRVSADREAPAGGDRSDGPPHRCRFAAASSMVLRIHRMTSSWGTTRPARMSSKPCRILSMMACSRLA